MNYEPRDTELHVVASSEWLGRAQQAVADRKIDLDDIQEISSLHRNEKKNNNSKSKRPGGKRKEEHDSQVDDTKSIQELKLAIRNVLGELEKERLQLKCYKWQARLNRTKLDHDKTILRVQQNNLQRAQERSAIIERSIKSLTQKTLSLQRQNEFTTNYLEKYQRVVQRQLDEEEASEMKKSPRRLTV